MLKPTQNPPKVIHISTNTPEFFKSIKEKYGERCNIIEDQFDYIVDPNSKTGLPKQTQIKDEATLDSVQIGKFLRDGKAEKGDIVICHNQLAFRCLSYLDSIGKFHFGLRNFSYGDLLSLDIFTHDDIRYIFLDNTDPKYSYNKINRKMASILDGSYFNNGYQFQAPNHEVYTLNEVDEFLNICNDLQGELAFDYESKNFPDYSDYETTGVSITNGKRLLYLDLRYYKDSETQKSGIKKLCDFLEKNHNRLWVFNKAFESLATYRMCHRFIDFKDVRALLICDEAGSNLKIAAQRYLQVGSWDDTQELLSEKYEWLFDKFWDYQDLVNYTKTDEFKSENGKDDVKIKNIIRELRTLKQDFGILRKYWGGSFATTPIDVVSKYCCLDSFYTLMIALLIIQNHPIYVNGRSEQ